MTIITYRVFTVSTAAFGGGDRKKDFDDFGEATAFATKQGDKVTGFHKIQTEDWSNVWKQKQQND